MRSLPQHGCGPEVDMWAVGVMLFFLLSGQVGPVRVYQNVMNHSNSMVSSNHPAKPKDAVVAQRLLLSM